MEVGESGLATEVGESGLALRHQWPQLRGQKYRHAQTLFDHGFNTPTNHRAGPQQIIGSTMNQMLLPFVCVGGIMPQNFATCQRQWKM